MATNIINQNLQNLQDPDTDMNQMIPEGGINFNNFLSNYPGRDRIQELQNIDFKNNPRDTATGPPSNFRHAAAMNELSKSLSPMNNKIGNFVGDSLAYGLGAINEIPDAFRGFSFREGFDPKAMADAKEDFSANYDGSYGTPNTATIEDVFANTLGYQAPGTNVVRQTASTGPLNYGTAQAAEINPTTNFNDSYNYNDVDAMTADEQGQLPFDQPTQNKNFLTGILESLSDLELQDYLPFGEKSISSMAARGAGNMVRGIGNFFQGNPRQRARNEANKRFGVGDIYGYGMGSASGANKDAFGFNTVSGFGNYEQHMRDQLDKLNARKEAGKTFKPGSWQNRMLKDYGKSISTIDAEAAAADRAERDKFNRMLSNMNNGGGGGGGGGGLSANETNSAGHSYDEAGLNG
jgi:hypothetical protein